MPDDGVSPKLTADDQRRFDDGLFPYPALPDEWILALICSKSCQELTKPHSVFLA